MPSQPINEQTLLANMRSQSATTSATLNSLAWNGLEGLDFVLTLGANTQLNIYNIPYGLRGKLHVIQDATGGRTLTFSNATVIGAAVNVAANAVTIYEVIPSANGTPIVYNLAATAAAPSTTSFLSGWIRLSGVNAVATTTVVTSLVATALTTGGDGGTALLDQPSTGDAGVIVTTPNNKCKIFDANKRAMFVSGEEIYGRITHAAGVYTIAYFYELNNTETVYDPGSTVKSWHIEIPYRFTSSQYPRDAIVAINRQDGYPWLKTQSATTATTATWDGNTGLDYILTLTGNATLTINNIPYGMRGKLQVVQDATGGRTLTFANAAVIGASVNTAANAITIYEVIPSANGVAIVFNLSSTAIASTYTAGSYTATIQAGTLTGNQIAYLPNNTGTLATIDQLRPFALTQPVFYVATNGLATNNGLTAATPLATIDQALAKLTKIDCNGFDPIINVAAGTYDKADAIYLPDLIGVANRCTIQGPSTAILRTTANAGVYIGVKGATLTRYRLSGIQLTANTSGIKLIRASSGTIEIHDVTVSGTAGLNLDAFTSFSGGALETFGTITLSGTFRLIFDVIGGLMNISETTFTGTATFTTFIQASNCAVGGYATLSTGTFTGKRYTLENSHIKTYGSGAAGTIGSTAGTYSYPTAPA